MKQKSALAILILAILMISTLTQAQAATPAAGKPCSTKNLNLIHSGYKFRCSLINKKWVWVRGAKVSVTPPITSPKPTTTPKPNLTQTPIPKLTPTPTATSSAPGSTIPRPTQSTPVATPTPTKTLSPAPSPTPSSSATPPSTPAVAPLFYYHPRIGVGSTGLVTGESTITTGTPKPVLSYRWFECLYVYGDNTQTHGGSYSLPSDCSLLTGQTGTTLPFGSYNKQRNIIVEVTATNIAGTSVMYSGTLNSSSRPSEYLTFELTGNPITGGDGVLRPLVKWDGVQGQTLSYQWFRCTRPHDTSLTLASDCQPHRTQTDPMLYLWGAELYGANSTSSDVGYYFLVKVRLGLGTILPDRYTNTLGPVTQKPN